MDPQTSVPPWMAEAQAHFERAQELYDADEFEESLRECQLAVESDPDNAEAYTLAGVLFEELDRPLDALKAYRQALKISPHMEEAEENLEALQEELASSSNELVTVARVNFPPTAEILKAKLEAIGISAVLIDAEMAYTNYLWAGAVGGVKVQVASRDRDAALEALGLKEEWDELEAEYLGEDEDEDEGEEADETGEGEAGEGEEMLDAADDAAEAAIGDEPKAQANLAEDLVASEDAEEQLAELTEEAVTQPPEDDPLALDAAGEPAPQPCPNCGSMQVHYEPYRTRLAYASWLVLGIPLPIPNRKWICENCGHEWKEGEEAPGEASPDA